LNQKVEKSQEITKQTGRPQQERILAAFGAFQMGMAAEEKNGVYESYGQRMIIIVSLPY